MVEDGASGSLEHLGEPIRFQDRHVAICESHHHLWPGPHPTSLYFLCEEQPLQVQEAPQEQFPEQGFILVIEDVWKDKDILAGPDK